MAVIRYTKTSFNEPRLITEDEYNYIKNELFQNATFEIDSSPETFSEHFKNTLRAFKYCLLICIAWIIIEEQTGTSETFDYFDIFAGIAFAGCIFILPMNLLLEGPSFATYLVKRKKYFIQLKFVLLNSSSYTEFCILYKSLQLSSSFSSKYEQWVKSENDKEEKSLKKTIDVIFTNIFYFIDIYVLYIYLALFVASVLFVLCLQALSR